MRNLSRKKSRSLIRLLCLSQLHMLLSICCVLLHFLEKFPIFLWLSAIFFISSLYCLIQVRRRLKIYLRDPDFQRPSLLKRNPFLPLITCNIRFNRTSQTNKITRTFWNERALSWFSVISFWKKVLSQILFSVHTDEWQMKFIANYSLSLV